MKTMLKVLSVTATVTVSTAAFADGTMKSIATLTAEGRVTGADATAPIDYADGANWIGGNAVYGTNQAAAMPEVTVGDGLRFVRYGSDLTVGALRAPLVSGTLSSRWGNRICLLVDGSIDLVNDTEDTPPSTGVLNFNGRIYGNIDQSTANFVSTGDSWIEFCGDYTSPGTLFSGAGKTSFRFDLYANQAGETRIDPISVTRYSHNAATISFYAPVGAGETVGYWNQTAGSPCLTRSGDVHALAAGTTVSGPGIPGGTFLKRVFDDGSIELSAAVTASVAGNAVTFAAFSPKLSLTFPELSSGSSKSQFRLFKYREQDEMRIEFTKLVDHRGLDVISTDRELYPATLILRNTRSQTNPVKFGTCRVEFAVPTDSQQVKAGIPNAVTQQLSTEDVTYLSVPSGVTAAITITNLVGRVVKEGAGTLELTLGDPIASSTGEFTVVEGILKVMTAVAETPAMGAIRVESGAALFVPATGLACGSFEAAADSVLVLDGDLLVTGSFGEYMTLCGSLTTGGSGSILFGRPGNTIRYEQPVGAVVGEPAFWVDVSQAATLTYADDGAGVDRVSRIDDVRGAGYPYATDAGLKPQLSKDALGNPSHIYFECVPTSTTPATSHTLIWNGTISNICSVFKVMCVREGGGQILGGEPFRRQQFSAWNTRLMSDTVTNRHPAIANGTILMNGVETLRTAGYPYPGGTTGTANLPATPETELVPVVVELHMASRVAKSASDCFEAEFIASYAGRNGNQRLYECIVYTNMLSETEKLKVRGYLMKKWLNAQCDYEKSADGESRVSSFELTGNTGIGVATGSAVLVDKLSGLGTLTKTGPGELHIGDVKDAMTSMEVEGGTVVVNSLSLTREAIPEGVQLHFDITDEASLTIVDYGSRTRVKEWTDYRDNGYVLKVMSPLQNKWPGRSKITTYNPITINVYELCDFGSRSSATVITDATAFGLYNGDTPAQFSDIRSLFGVYHSQPLPATPSCMPLGTVDDHTQIDNGHSWGLAWTNNDIAASGVYPKVLGYGNGGGTRVRINSTDVLPSDNYATGSNLLSLVTYEEVGMSGLGAVKMSEGHIECAGFAVGEVIVYKEAFSKENARKVEAYLAKKWYNIETAGYRPAEVDLLKVASGATLRINGGAPISANTLAAGGTIEGSVALRASASLHFSVDGNGAIIPLAITGTIDMSNGGEIVIDVAAKPLEVGEHVLIPASALASPPDLGNWPFRFINNDTAKAYAAKLKLVDGALVLNVARKGTALVIR